jgi:hypothetical protein
MISFVSLGVGMSAFRTNHGSAFALAGAVAVVQAR